MSRFLALALLLCACGDDDGTVELVDARYDTVFDARIRFDAPVGSPVGAWSQSSVLFACFGTGGSADFADSIADVTTTPCCYWDVSGNLYYPNNQGTWTLDGLGRLVITVDPPCGDACGPETYERLDTVDCQF